MAQVAILKQFLESKIKLTSEEQAVVDAFVIEFYDNPASPGISLERIKKASKGVWSGRVSQDLRTIIFKDGDTWAFLHVDHHNPAYKWAENRKIGRHQATGALEIVEVVETIREVEKIVTVAKAPKVPPLFDDHSDDYLLSLGVALDWLPTLRKVRTEEQLLIVCEKIPEDIAERLIDVANGTLVTPPTPMTSDQPLATSADNARRFYVVEGEDELRKMLAAPMETWIAFLHPSQKALVAKEFNGPAKVTGSAGTGKTVVAMHRARHLARQGKRVLLTSFVSTLCKNIERNLSLLCTEEERAQITVSTIHSQALGLVQSHDASVRVVNDDEIRQMVERLGRHYASSFDARFLWAEWQNVVQAQELTSWDAYRGAQRVGRGKPLTVRDRKTLWKVFGAIQQELELDSKVDWTGLCRRAQELLAQGKVKSPFDAVIVDELQDLKPADIRLVRALCAENLVDLMVVGDAGQRIYPGGFSLLALGLEVRGRSSVLRINYRTTEQIRRAADRILGFDVDDMDGGTEAKERAKTRSLLTGPEPALEGFPTQQAEDQGAVTQVKIWLGEGLRPEAIGLFARTRKRLESVKQALEASDVPTCLLSDSSDESRSGVRLGTMHRAKGLEFKSVLVLDCGRGAMPNSYVLKQSDDPQDRAAATARERRLLYVSMTRARDDLAITWRGDPSPFLEELLKEKEVEA